MNSDTIRDYLQRTAMDEAQAEALSRIFAEMATKSDLLILQEKVDSRGRALEEKLDIRFLGFEERIEHRFVALEEKFEHRFVALEEKFTGQMARLQADLSWKMIAIVGFFGTVITILNAFIG